MGRWCVDDVSRHQLPQARGGKQEQAVVASVVGPPPLWDACGAGCAGERERVPAWEGMGSEAPLRVCAPPTPAATTAALPLPLDALPLELPGGRVVAAGAAGATIGRPSFTKMHRVAAGCRGPRPLTPSPAQPGEGCQRAR